MTPSHRIAPALLALAMATTATAQAPSQGGSLPPIRPLGKVKAASTELLGAVSQVRALPDGRVLVNDNLGRKVVLFDASLATGKVVADTTSATANAYSSRAGGLIQYKGDSTLFVDPTALSMLVIDGKGEVARVMSVPRANDAVALIGGPNGTPGFDAQGRLVYRGGFNLSFGGGRGAPMAMPGQPGFQMPTIPDTSAVIRIDLETRKVDTVAFVKISSPKLSMTTRPDGGMSISSITNPMPVLDDWVVTADGRVAILRGQDYRVEWMENGKVASTNKVPFAWRRLDDSAKTAFIDSTRKAMEVLRQQAMARMQAGGGPMMLGPGDPMAAGMAGGAQIRIEMRGGGGDGAPPPRPQQNGPGGANTRVDLAPLQFIPASDLPDYAPAFTAGAARADAEGNIWVRTSNAVSGGSVYDVINAKGELTDRVLLPPGRVIAGFGKGVVYMGVREGSGVRLEAAPMR